MREKAPAAPGDGRTLRQTLGVTSRNCFGQFEPNPEPALSSLGRSRRRPPQAAVFLTVRS